MNRLSTHLVTATVALGTLLVLGIPPTSHAQEGESLPYEATFESSNGFTPGSVNGQRGFTVVRGQARVVEHAGRASSAGLKILPSRPFGIAQLRLDPSSVVDELDIQDAQVLHTEFYVRPGAAPAGEQDQFADVEGSLTGFFKIDKAGELFIYDGPASREGDGQWLPSGTRFAIDETGNAREWIQSGSILRFARISRGGFGMWPSMVASSEPI